MWEPCLETSNPYFSNIIYFSILGLSAFVYLAKAVRPLCRYVSKNFKLAQRSQIVDQKKEKLFCFKMSLILLQCDLYIKSCDKF